LHAKADSPKNETKYIGAESFNRLKKVPGGPGRGGRGAGKSSR
jgi:23S rRNA pseudouridine2605 synthase